MSVCLELPLHVSPRRAERTVSVLGKRQRNMKPMQIVNGRLRAMEPSRNAATSATSTELESGHLGGPPDGEIDSHPSESSGDEDAELHAMLVASTSANHVSTNTLKTSKSRSTTPSNATKRTKVRYYCDWEGCDKSYTKPTRLAEHTRSHTGERPFMCSFGDCDASYLRENHLTAHMRTHKSEEEKPLSCNEPDCDKRFWTNQHLNRHIKLVHDKDKDAYKCEQCTEAFNKHHKLREHVAKVHMPPGTMPFFCEHEACGKSFATGSKLRSHAKIHEEDRYVCMHPSHLPQVGEVANNAAIGEHAPPPHFQTWTALQEHNKEAHPPTCSHAGCGKKFGSAKALRKHILRRHVSVSDINHLSSTDNERDTMPSDYNGRDCSANVILPDNAAHPTVAQARPFRPRRPSAMPAPLISTQIDGIPGLSSLPFNDFDGDDDYDDVEAD